MKIGILGGTFDPIHKGHLALARHALAQFHLDKVLFVPSARPPHKKNIRSMIPVKHRLKMVRLATEKFKRFQVSDLEIKRRGPSYTVDTVKALQKKCPRAEFYLILGQDAYAGLEGWNQPGEIRKRVGFLVAKRSLSRIAKKKGTQTEWVRMPLCATSSSEVRNMIKSGRPAEGHLPKSVARYIKDHRLYRRGHE